jgi:hypothetical protein
VFEVPACADPRGATSPFRHTIQFSRTEPRTIHSSAMSYANVLVPSLVRAPNRVALLVQRGRGY